MHSNACRICGHKTVSKVVIERLGCIICSFFLFQLVSQLRIIFQALKIFVVLAYTNVYDEQERFSSCFPYILAKFALRMVDYLELSDEELAALLRGGDEPAFTVIYHRYWRLMYGHIYKMLRDEDEAKDLLQDLFSGLWINHTSFPQSVNLSGYLYVSARNKVLNLIRKQKYRNDYLGSLAAFASESSNETLELLNERDLLAAIEREIENLPPRMRQVFEMSRKENLSHKEIAARLGTSDETVKKQINKSLKQIKLGLKDTGTTALALLLLLR